MPIKIKTTKLQTQLSWNRERSVSPLGALRTMRVFF